MRNKIAWVTLVVCAIVLFGSMAWTLLSQDPVPFVVGYPVAVALLIVAYILRPVRLL